MVNTVIMFIIAAFMMVGVADKVFFKSRFGFGEDFEAGIMQAAGLILSLVGIMCLAPLLGKLFTPVVSPIYRLIGADPANFSGIILTPDGGGYALSQAMTDNHVVSVLSGLFLAAMLGTTISFSLPVSMGIVEDADRAYLSKGMLAGIIATPFGAVISGLLAGFPLGFMLQSLIPAFVIVAVLVVALKKAEAVLIRGFLMFSKGITAAAVISLGFAGFELLTGIKLIPWMDSIGDKFTTVGTIGITIAGALCAIRFIKTAFKKTFTVLGKLLRVNDVAVVGIVSSLANAIPVYSMVKDMDNRGKILSMAFAVPACYALGGHLAYTAAVLPEYIMSLVLGKIFCGILAMVIAYILF